MVTEDQSLKPNLLPGHVTVSASDPTEMSLGYLGKARDLEQLAIQVSQPQPTRPSDQVGRGAIKM
jgi:hypothetical protein